MGRSSEGSGHSRRCTLDATNDATPAPGRARQARGKFPIGGLRQACGKVPTPLHGVNHFVSRTQHYGPLRREEPVEDARRTPKCAKTARFSTRPRQLLSASTKCHSSTAENSPKRSWISRSDHSRK